MELHYIKPSVKKLSYLFPLSFHSSPLYFRFFFDLLSHSFMTGPLESFRHFSSTQIAAVQALGLTSRLGTPGGGNGTLPGADTTNSGSSSIQRAREEQDECNDFDRLPSEGAVKRRRLLAVTAAKNVGIPVSRLNEYIEVMPFFFYTLSPSY